MAETKRTTAERAAHVTAARELFEHAQMLDGYGLVVTDDNLLARTIARTFAVRPGEVYDEYDKAWL